MPKLHVCVIFNLMHNNTLGLSLPDPQPRWSHFFFLNWKEHFFLNRWRTNSCYCFSRFFLTSRPTQMVQHGWFISSLEHTKEEEISQREDWVQRWRGKNVCSGRKKRNLFWPLAGDIKKMWFKIYFSSLPGKLLILERNIYSSDASNSSSPFAQLQSLFFWTFNNVKNGLRWFD